MSRRGRKRKMAVEDKATFEWEKDKILPENLRDEMETMWEIPQIYHFLQLTKEALNISHLSMYEVERMLLMPKASKQLAHIMTSLLSSPSITKAKSQRVPPMPYEFWTNILIYKLRSWFKMYQTKHQDAIKVFDALGIEPEFWTIFPSAEKIEGMDFQDFTFKQRVWLLKTICDTAMHSRKTVQEEIAKQPWESQFETVLGIDRYGARYVYFPQFLHNDLRVYRHCLDNSILSTVKPPTVEKPKLEPVIIKEEPKAMPRTVVRRKRRKSRWSSGSLPTKHKTKKKIDLPFIDSADSNSNSIDTCFSKSSKSSAVESVKSSGYETAVSGETVVDDNEKDASERDVEVLQEKLTEGEIQDCSKVVAAEKSFKDSAEQGNSKDAVTAENLKDNVAQENTKDTATDNCSNQDNEEATVVDEKASKKECTLSTSDEVSTSSKTDDEKLEEMNVLKVTDKCEEACASVAKDVNISKSDDEKLSESKNCDTLVNGECANEDTSLEESTNAKDKEEAEHSNDDDVSDSGTRRSARIRLISEIKMEVEDAETALNVSETEELCSIDLRDKICRVSSPELDANESNYSENDWKVQDFSKLLNDLSVSNFQLVADSIDSLKDLTEYITSDKTVPGFQVEKDYFTRPACEEKLLKRMKVLLTSLENVDSILKESTKKARNKLQREWNNFENGVVDEETEAGADRWLVNSQGCAFSPLATLSQSSLSGTRESTSTDEVASGTDTTATATDKTTTIDAQGCQGLKDASEDAARKKKEEDGGRRGEDDEEKATEDGGAESEQTVKRVLRARGVSSYTEQLFSDDEESEEDELDGWADIEAIYATPSTQASSSTPDTPAKAQNSGVDTEEEDSDKDWILPSSRKRRSKRPSANRRLKSFNQKICNIKENGCPQILSPKEKDTKPVTILRSRSSTPSKPPSRQPTPAATPEGKSQMPILAADNAEVKTEQLPQQAQDPSIHSVLDIKDEGPIYDGSQQPNLLVVTTGHANYVVMQQQNTPVTAMMQQTPFIQPAFVSPTMVAQPQGYYVQTHQPQNYIVQNPPGLIATAGSRPAFIATTNPQLVYQPNQQPMQYVQYVAAPQQQVIQPSPSQPRIINTMTLTPPRQLADARMKAPSNVAANRMPTPTRPPFPHPNGAVIRSAPLAPNVLRPGQRVVLPRGGARRQAPRMPIPNNKSNAATNTPKSTSLIVLSDSDDEIEMIIPEKSKPASPIKPPTTSLLKAKPPVTPQKPALPPELVQRMSEGNISISPVKPAQPPPAQNTQLVVVVNETGSHYALALPNGSKLILTPEQVAQIRASNGGKLLL